MPVLGASTTEDVVWDEPQRPLYGHLRINKLSSYFVYHTKSSMNFRYGETEWAIVTKHVQDMRRSGYSDRDIRSMIDTFYLQWAGKDTHPVYEFARNEVRDRLLAPYNPEVKNPVLQFIYDGLTRGRDPLPWFPEDDAPIRHAVMVYGGEVAYRYPDVLCTLLISFGDDIDVLTEQLQSVSDLLRWKLSKNFDNRLGHRYVSRVKIPLPSELASNTRVVSNIRPAAPTLQRAVSYFLGRTNRERRNANRLEE